MKPILAWRFLRNDTKLGAHADEPGPLTPGRAYHAADWREAGLRGLSGTTTFKDALLRGQGMVACYVRLDGEIRAHPNGRIDATELTIVCIGDAILPISLFFCDETERLLLEERMEGREPDLRTWNALRMKRAWLQDQATDRQWHAAQREAQSAEKDKNIVRSHASIESQELRLRAWYPGWWRRLSAAEREQRLHPWDTGYWLEISTEEELLRKRAWEADARELMLIRASAIAQMALEGAITSKRDVEYRLSNLAHTIVLPRAIPNEPRPSSLPRESILEEQAALYERLEKAVHLGTCTRW